MSFVDPESFNAGMRCLAGGVAVVTTEDRGVKWGMTVTAVCSFTASPPTLLVCINRDAEAHDHIMASRKLGVSLLRGDQTKIAQVFSGAFGHKGDGRFEEVGWHQLSTGAPLLDDCVAVFDCEVMSWHECNTHRAFICGVVDIGIDSGPSPLLYFNRGFATLQTQMST
ncbi:flavin reductase family protein [Ferrovibrio sp.]|uniref:flavin reductase family protein n=1 Tax=Ferrovibrio sp. TaxID=1917215 RepID=UPI0035B4C4A1